MRARVAAPGAFYLLDRGYLDYQRLYAIHQSQAFFVTRAKSNTKFQRRYSQPVDRANTQIICDQTGVLTVYYTAKDYPQVIRRVVAKDENGKRLTFLTNNFALSPEMIAALYRQRWQVELFFKWIKQHLRIKTFQYQRECSQDANLDRGLHIRADRDTQKTFETAQQSSRNSTNLEFDYV